MSYANKNENRFEKLFQGLRKKIWESGFYQNEEPKPITYELIKELEELRNLHQELEIIHDEYLAKLISIKE